MRIPYVIDNLETRLADVLNYLLQRQTGQLLDVWDYRLPRAIAAYAFKQDD